MATPSTRTRWLILLFAGVLSIAADQATKIWARHSLPTNPPDCVVPYDIAARKCFGTPVPVVDGFWDWELNMNLGAAFSMFAGQMTSRILLSLVGLIAVGAMFFMFKRAREDQRILHWALAFIMGGAIGNLIDRIYFGSVTDFILWRYKTHRWPVFNIADVVLVIGVGLMVIDMLRESKREKLAKQAKTKA